LAARHGIETLKPARPSEPEFMARLSELAPDCCPVVAYGALIPQSVLDIPRIGWINLHFSLLPAWRGAAPVQHAIKAGDEITGATTFLLEAGMDTGPVFGHITDVIGPHDTSGDLLQRLSVTGAELLVRTLDGIESGELVAVPQIEEGVSLAPKVLVDDAKVDWTHPALAIDRLIRSCTPAPGAWTTFRDERLKLGAVTLEAEVTDLAPGQLRVSKQAVLVGTGSCAVALGRVQPIGKKPMGWKDWVNGARPTDSDVVA
jgi:methionyl-tRNA formyltransferase